MLEWLGQSGWAVAYGPELAPSGSMSERSNYSDITLASRLRYALSRLNPDLPASALDDAFRKLTRPAGSTPDARNRSFHRMLVDGVPVEYRTPDGSIRGHHAPSPRFRPARQQTTGWPSTSSPSSRADAGDAWTSCCSSTGFRWA